MVFSLTATGISNLDHVENGQQDCFFRCTALYSWSFPLYDDCTARRGASKASLTTVPGGTHVKRGSLYLAIRCAHLCSAAATAEKQRVQDTRVDCAARIADQQADWSAPGSQCSCPTICGSWLVCCDKRMAAHWQ